MSDPHYRPPWYPNRDPLHNPWATDPGTIMAGGKSFYMVWVDSLPPGELVRLIRESHNVDS